MRKHKFVAFIVMAAVTAAAQTPALAADCYSYPQAGGAAWGGNSSVCTTSGFGAQAPEVCGTVIVPPRFTYAGRSSQYAQDIVNSAPYGDCGTTPNWFWRSAGVACPTPSGQQGSCEAFWAGQTPCATPGAPAATPEPSPIPTPVPTPAPSPSPSTSPDYYTQGDCSAQAQTMAGWINAERAANGLPALILDSELCKVATLKSKDMLDNHYFAHESPTYGSMSDMLKQFGVPFTACGENIASHASIEKSHAAFMSSDGHRRNILGSSWQRMGIGVVFDKDGFVRVTEVFAR